MKHIAEAFLIIALIVLCYGSPDILDGLIKRANMECGK